MKTIKSMILILLFTSLSTTTINGKSISTSSKTVTPPAPLIKKDTPVKTAIDLSAQTYKQLHHHIAAMKPESVISKDNMLSDYFINFVKDNVKKSNLPLIFAQALLEMGRNLHMQFSGDNKQALQTLQKSNNQIQNILNTLKPVTQTEKPKPPVKPVEQKKELSGIEKLHELRKQSATQPLEKFYSQATVNQQWLEKALNLVLNGKPFTTQNKQVIQGEMVGNATELTRELLQKNNITGQTRSIILESVEKQVITFMNNQPLADQKQQQQTPAVQPSLPIAVKKPSQQPATPEPKKTVVEPIKKPIPAEQKPETIIQLPQWISKEHTLVVKEFEIAMLDYVFKHQDATEENILHYFVQQLPAQIKNKEVIVNGMKAIIAKTFKESETPLPAIPEKPQPSPAMQISKKKLPSWIIAESFNIARVALKEQIFNYFAQHPNADNDEIFNHLIQQLPDDIPDKKIIHAQVRAIIDSYFE